MISLRFLGTGPAGGVEARGKSKRGESSALIETEAIDLLLDVSGDFERQAKWLGRPPVILITHGHRDAIGGLARLRGWLTKKGWKRVYLYAEKETIAVIKKRFKRTEHLAFVPIEPEKEFKVGGIAATSLRVRHSIQRGFPTLGYFFKFEKGQSLAYVSDAAGWERRAESLMKKADTLVIDGAMWKKVMVAHLSIKKILPRLCRWGNRRIIFTQIGREVPDHEAAQREVKRICAKASLAFDGMKLTIS